MGNTLQSIRPAISKVINFCKDLNVPGWIAIGVIIILLVCGFLIYKIVKKIKKRKKAYKFEKYVAGDDTNEGLKLMTNNFAKAINNL